MTPKELRESMHLTWSQFARMVGVNIRTVARWEAEPKAGEKPCKPSKLAQDAIDRLLQRKGEGK